MIFDSHEDVGATILDKHYLKPYLRKMIYMIYKLYEKYSLKKFSGIIAATPYIKKQLLNINSNSIDVCNYPIISELENNKSKTFSDNFNVCYVGGITKKRGLVELVRSLEITKNSVSLNLAGNFLSKAFEKEIRNLPGLVGITPIPVIIFFAYLGICSLKKTVKKLTINEYKS